LSSAWDGLLNNKEITELPHYAINKSLPADSYFTSTETAKKCVDIVMGKIDTKGFTFLEPSAGSGAFYDLLPEDRRIGIELFNRRKDFIKQDYLTWYPEDNSSKYIVIGNPPFGVRGAYALAFVNRSLLFAEYVAFILPMSFHSNGKGSNMKRVENGHLIFSQVLEKESFYSPDNNKEIKVNTLFQIWKRGEGESIFPDYDTSKHVDIFTVCSSPDRLCGLDKIGTYDFYVSSTYFGNTLKTVYDFDDVKYGSGYGIIIKDNKKDLLQKIKEVEWDTYSTMATNSCKHIRKYSIQKCLFDLGYGEKVK
tara:strand:+ start:571 stop:1494 length:924 start_codon:yes stop_codon:yes gene_type:complete